MKPNPQRPLKPTFVNEKARIEEHDRLRSEAMRRHGGLVCPDCYEPPATCCHWKELRREGY